MTDERKSGEELTKEAVRTLDSLVRGIFEETIEAARQSKDPVSRYVALRNYLLDFGPEAQTIAPIGIPDATSLPELFYDQPTFADFVKASRLYRQLNQRQLSKLTGYTPSGLCRLESGKEGDRVLTKNSLEMLRVLGADIKRVAEKYFGRGND